MGSFGIGGSGLVYFGLGVENGFVREIAAEGFEAVEFLDGAAVLALGLGLIAEEKLPGVFLFCRAAETFGDGVVAVLGRVGQDRRA